MMIGGVVMLAHDALLKVDERLRRHTGRADPGAIAIAPTPKAKAGACDNPPRR